MCDIKLSKTAEKHLECGDVNVRARANWWHRDATDIQVWTMSSPKEEEVLSQWLYWPYCLPVTDRQIAKDWESLSEGHVWSAEGKVHTYQCNFYNKGPIIEVLQHRVNIVRHQDSA